MSGLRGISGRTAVVTGAASGIGRATALRLAAEGMHLVLADIDSKRLEQVAHEVGNRLLIAQRCDVTDRASVQALADAVHARVSAVDVLVNNAGIAVAGGIVETSLDDWDRVIDVNLRGVVHVTKAFVGKMVERRDGGQIVNVSSVLGFFPAPWLVAYSSTKWAVLGMTESMRSELDSYGIGVTAVCPGLVDTRIVDGTRFPDSAKASKARERVQQLYRDRAVPPEQVAEAVLKAIRTNPAILPVTKEAWLLYGIRRVSPEALGVIGKRLAARFVK